GWGCLAVTAYVFPSAFTRKPAPATVSGEATSNTPMFWKGNGCWMVVACTTWAASARRILAEPKSAPSATAPRQTPTVTSARVVRCIRADIISPEDFGPNNLSPPAVYVNGSERGKPRD